MSEETTEPQTDSGVAPLSFDETQARLDEIFWYCEETKTTPWDDRRHLTISGVPSVAELRGALRAMRVNEDLFLIDHLSGSTAKVSIYDESADTGE